MWMIKSGFCGDEFNGREKTLSMVRERGLEPPPLTGPDPKSGVSAISPLAQPANNRRNISEPFCSAQATSPKSERWLWQSHLRPARTGLATWPGGIRGIPRSERRESETGRRQRRGVSEAAGIPANHVESDSLGRTGQTAHYQRSTSCELMITLKAGRTEARSAPACRLTLFNILITVQAHYIRAFRRVASK